tara:strand:+ start:2475 stop:2855 length:381 start_codon:yes stop_codon:yes gene_type:complete
MSEYDNTNRGAGFPPYDEEKMVLTGKINVDGKDSDVMYVAGTTKSGQRVLRIYQKMGIMFEQEDTSNGKPNYSGPLDNTGAFIENKKIAAWKKTTEAGLNMISLQVSEKTQSTPKDNIDIDDVIPF